MKLIIVFLLFYISIPLMGQNYELVWSDEFNGQAVDGTVWTHETGANGWGNNEWQYYTSREENSYVQNGNLVIEARKEQYSGSSYTSARMITKGKKFFKYGKIEARMKLPFGQGIWPAFWMLGENFSSVGWPACGEIDIMEMVGGQNRENTIHGTVHWDNNGQHAQYGGSRRLSSGTYADNFHIFAIEWDKNEIRWYMDGVRYHAIDIRGSGLSEFHKNFFIILNVAVGGNWPGYPDGTTTFPQKLMVDYVRVYQDLSNHPTVTITSPAVGADLSPFSDVEIEANAADADGTIKRVDFYQGDALLGSDDSAPYSFTWENVYPGCYSISAKAYDNDSKERKSETLEVKVGGSCVQAPYLGTPFVMPGVIDAELFDLPGTEESYFDTDAVNSGNDYGNRFRMNSGVDIQPSAAGGYNLGWIETGEWTEYSIYVPSNGVYNIVANYASPNSTGKIYFQIDDESVADTIELGSTGDWQNWGSASSNGFSLKWGDHKLKAVADAGGFNLNFIEMKMIIQTNVSDEIEMSYKNRLDVYPNPFNSNAKILLSADLTSTTRGLLTIFNMLGEKITSKQISVNPGENSYHFTDSENLNSGFYLIGIEFGSVRLFRKVVYLK